MRRGPWAVAAMAVLCAELATGCGGGKGGSADADGSSGTTPTPSATAPVPSSSELDELNRLVDGAESAADKADSDAANDH
ncbi:hypothetical protein [Streptomyces sp. 8ZJF_21]|uniref:hypothetical protein n=1 Tax=Streptomyces sp. 8ZJF_21 TaxID=2903141 RepID=UPI001E54E52E|nr:hypothetical protein [Streptomyces sp. 8ZJF_21]MCD9591662.1 hypothetical protein [Streptomyces sp. 8ZJF_21]